MPFRPRAVISCVAMLALLLAGMAPSPGAGASPSGAPGLRLFAADHSITIHRYGRFIYPDFGAWLQATGGDFRLNVTRDDYRDPIGATQVDAATGDTIRTISPEMVDGWRGLADFTRVKIKKASGKTVFKNDFRFCPNYWYRQRVTDQGPVDPTYPDSCRSWSPFTKGMVWGLNKDWAVNPLDQALRVPSEKVPDGTYTLTIKVVKAFADLLGMPSDQRSISLKADIKSFGRGVAIRRPFTRQEATSDPSPAPKVPTNNNPDPSTIPDLVALPAWQISASHQHKTFKDYLNFAAMEWSGGPGRLVVEGYRKPDTNTMKAYEYFYDTSGNPVSRARVGNFEYDNRKGHHHWHFAQFARYSLLSTNGDQVVRSHKQSFCIAPTNAIDLVRPAAVLDPEIGFGSYCGDASSIWVREELPTGWGDTYYQGRAGQSFNITHVPNGWYDIEVEVNPTGQLIEKRTGNDSELRLIHLGGNPGHRTVLVAPWHGIDP